MVLKLGPSSSAKSALDIPKRVKILASTLAKPIAVFNCFRCSGNSTVHTSCTCPRKPGKPSNGGTRLSNNITSRSKAAASLAPLGGFR
jgi:hypothetical protein